MAAHPNGAGPGWIFSSFPRSLSACSPYSIVFSHQRRRVMNVTIKMAPTERVSR
jgi:hypothetical protein